MTQSERRVAQLEQALFAILSAAEQLGLRADDIRLLAIGGLAINGPWGWVDNEYVAGAIDEIQSAAGASEDGRRRCFDMHYHPPKA